MKNPQLNNVLKNHLVVNEFYPLQNVLGAFKKMGFMEDFITNRLTVLRNTSFPFQRIVVPNDNKIHIELLKLYSKDMGISLHLLIDAMY
jgi:hypothetical protein